MNKVYVLLKEGYAIAVVTKEQVAVLFTRQNLAQNDYIVLELDDPELLNRIAKESEKKN